MRKTKYTVVNAQGVKVTKIMRMLAITMAASLIFSSCAVMFGGSKYNAHIELSDPGAEIYINGMKRGTGNATILLPRKDNLNIEVQKDGCEDLNMTYPNQLRATFALNFISWGLVGIIIDFATGATYRPDVDTPGVLRLNQKTFQYKVKFDCKEEN